MINIRPVVCARWLFSNQYSGNHLILIAITRQMIFFCVSNLRWLRKKNLLMPFSFEATRSIKVSEIVKRDYRTADVFRKFGISYCCGGNWPLETACNMNGVELRDVTNGLNESVRDLRLPAQIDFHSWETVFLVDYIINVHHHFLKTTLPLTGEMLADFVAEHDKKYTYLPELQENFNRMIAQVNATMENEEQVIFPYIRQLVHAHRHREPYAALFIRTFRKPLEGSLTDGIFLVNDMLTGIRKITKQYTTPEKACVSHFVVISKLRELDADLMQHVYLEQSVLYPRILQMERSLLDPSTGEFPGLGEVPLL